MKFIVAFFGFLIFYVVSAEDVKKFTTKYDNVNIDEILRSSRLFDNYYNCVMNKGKCTPDGLELKNAIPLALQTECAGCSEKQKFFAEKVIKHIARNMPDRWESLQNQYDPQRIYSKKHADLAEKHGIKV